VFGASFFVLAACAKLNDGLTFDEVTGETRGDPGIGGVATTCGGGDCVTLPEFRSVA
jgi:hypothetical protein